MRAVTISALRYMETAFWEYRVIGGLTIYKTVENLYVHFE